MKISARNQFSGTVGTVKDGSVNAEVTLKLSGGDEIVAIVTRDSIENLGLIPGKPATAFVKASWVLLLTGGEKVRVSARNHLAGTVETIKEGAVNSEVAVRLNQGTLVHAIVTNQAVQELALKTGAPASVLIKASHVILGVAD